MNSFLRAKPQNTIKLYFNLVTITNYYYIFTDQLQFLENQYNIEFQQLINNLNVSTYQNVEFYNLFFQCHQLKIVYLHRIQ